MCKKDTIKFIITILIAIATAMSVSAQSSSEVYDFEVDIYGEGRDIIMIPGLSSPSAVWNSTAETLKDQYRLHVLSLPGFAGHEPIDVSNHFLPKMAKQIVEYIENNQLDDPILMGHSLGGFLSLYIGIENSDVISGIVSVDGVPFLPAMINPASTAETGKMMAAQMVNQLKSLEGEQRRQMHQQTIATMITDPEKQKIAVEWSMNSDVETIARAIKELYTIDLREQLSNINVPILVLGAWKGYENYGITKEMTERMLSQQYAKAYDVTIKVSESGKHFLMWDDPDFVIESFQNFIKESII